MQSETFGLPLQGFRFNGVAFPGLRPGLTYSAPAGLRSVRIRYLERTFHSRNKLAGSDQREENGGSPFRESAHEVQPAEPDDCGDAGQYRVWRQSRIFEEMGRLPRARVETTLS